MQQVDANVEALALAAGEAALGARHVAAHRSVASLDQAQFVDDLIDTSAQLGRRRALRQAQRRGEEQGLLAGGQREERVFLLDVRAHLDNVLRVARPPTERDFARELALVLVARGHAPGERVQKARLAGAARAKDGQQLAAFHRPTQVV